MGGTSTATIARREGNTMWTIGPSKRSEDLDDTAIEQLAAVRQQETE